MTNGDRQVPDVRQLRARLMLTIDEMALQCGVNRSTIRRWEEGLTERSVAD